MATNRTVAEKAALEQLNSEAKSAKIHWSGHGHTTQWWVNKAVQLQADIIERAGGQDAEPIWLVKDVAEYKSLTEIPAAREVAAVAYQVWVSVEERLPERGIPIEMAGNSGYIKPHDQFVISGYYDDQYQPLSPWLDSTGTCTAEMGWNPTHWRLLQPLPSPPTAESSKEKI